MIRLLTALLLSLGVNMVVGYSEPNCELCDYFNGIGFLKSTDPEYCTMYFMCIRDDLNEGDYVFYPMCCAEGLSFNEKHQTCEPDEDCDQTDFSVCPVVTTTQLNCPYEAVVGEPTKYYIPATQDIMPCPYGLEWDQDNCTCLVVDGPLDAPCDKVLHFNFSGSYDSYSCYNYAKGDPYGNPPLDGDMICFEQGKSQMLSIGYLNNFFAWNPVGQTFTMCFWMKVYEDQTAGVLSTNCYYENDGSVLEVYLVSGELVLKLGGSVVNTGKFPPYLSWSKVCVTFDNGHYEVFFDKVKCGMTNEAVQAVNSHSATTLGYVQNMPPLDGYLDDFCFWTRVLSQTEIDQCFHEGRSE